MKPSRLIASLALAAAAAVLPAARAQYVPPPPAAPIPVPGMIDDTLRASNPYLNAWDVGINYRLRFEDKLGAGFTNAGSNWDFATVPVGTNNNDYWLSRLMPRVGATEHWYAFLVEARSSYSLGDNRYSRTAPGHGLTEDNEEVQVHQAFVFLGNHKEFPLSLKIGRQELIYGDQRLVGAFKWNNDARSFDAAKLRWQNPVFGVDLFTGGVVYNWQGHFNRSNPHDRLSGAYFNFPHLPAVSANNLVEGYILARNTERRAVLDDWSKVPSPFRFPAPQDIYTVGARIKSKPAAFGPWDYTAEVMYQFGDRTAVFPATTVAAALAAPRLRQQAEAAVFQGGYTWTESALQPRLALIYSYASGDRNPTDGRSTTFQNLFPTNHLLYGAMDLSSLQNLHDIRLAASLKPTPTTTFAIEAHQQYLASTSDYWYNVSMVPRNFTGAPAGSGRGYRINPGYSSGLGQEVDLLGGWAFRTDAALEAGFGHYFRGDYIKQSLAVTGSKDANYLYVQLTINL